MHIAAWSLEPGSAAFFGFPLKHLEQPPLHRHVPVVVPFPPAVVVRGAKPLSATGRNDPLARGVTRFGYDNDATSCLIRFPQGGARLVVRRAESDFLDVLVQRFEFLQIAEWIWPSAMFEVRPGTIYIIDQIKEGFPKCRVLASEQTNLGRGMENDYPKVFRLPDWLRPDSRQHIAINPICQATVPHRLFVRPLTDFDTNAVPRSGFTYHVRGVETSLRQIPLDDCFTWESATRFRKISNNAFS